MRQIEKISSVLLALLAVGLAVWTVHNPATNWLVSHMLTLTGWLDPSSAQDPVQLRLLLERRSGMGRALQSLLVGGVSIAFFVVFLWLRGRNLSYGEHCRCSKCGYILKGLIEPRCPECGTRI